MAFYLAFAKIKYAAQHAEVARNEPYRRITLN